jgi:predicted metalloendopeptidase
LSKNVLYPDSWEPYSFEDADFAAKEEGGTLWEAYRALKKHEHGMEVSKASEPYDKTVWDSFPFVVNCGYVPDVNGIYINA